MVLPANCKLTLFMQKLAPLEEFDPIGSDRVGIIVNYGLRAEKSKKYQ